MNTALILMLMMGMSKYLLVFYLDYIERPRVENAKHRFRHITGRRMKRRNGWMEVRKEIGAL